MILTKKRGLDITIEQWGWLAKTGKEKHEWPDWEKYGGMAANCPLCEYNRRHPIRSRHCNCILSDGVANCLSMSFGNWARAETIKSHKFYATKFLNELKAIRDA